MVVSDTVASVILYGIVVVGLGACGWAVAPNAARYVLRRGTGEARSLDSSGRPGTFDRIARWPGAFDRRSALERPHDAGASDTEDTTAEDGDRSYRREGRRHLVIVALIASVVVAVQIAWVVRNRHFSNLDFDEARYVATAIRFRELLSFREAGGFRLFNGPAMPLLSGAVMLVAPATAAVAISATLPLNVALAVSVTGVARHVMAARGALYCGVAVAVLPVTMALSQAYLLAEGAAVGFAAGMWALLASEHGENRRIWLVGPLFALAALSRGMAFGLMPVAVLAVVLHTSASARGLRRGVAVMGATSALLGCFFLTWGRGIVGYVLGGLTASETQSPGILGRLNARWGEIADGFGQPLLHVGVILAILGVVRRRREGGRSHTVRGDALATVTVFVLGALAVHLTGGYYGPLGFWDFQLMPLLLVLLVAMATTVLQPRARALLAGVTLGWWLYLATVSVWLLPHDAPLVAFGVGRYSESKIEHNLFDPRFRPGRRIEQRDANREWWAASLEIEARLRRLERRSPEPLEVFYRGGSSYFVEHSSWIIGARAGREPIGYIGDLGQMSDGDVAALLEPATEGSRRVLMIPVIGASCGDGGGCSYTRDHLRQIMDSDPVRLNANLRGAAEEAGWRVIERIPLPLGDEMLVYAPPTT